MLILPFELQQKLKTLTRMMQRMKICRKKLLHKNFNFAFYLIDFFICFCIFLYFSALKIWFLTGICSVFFFTYWYQKITLFFIFLLSGDLERAVLLFSTRRGRPWWYCFCWNCMSPEKITPFVLKNKRYFLSVIKTFRLFLENLRSAMLTLVLVTFS